MTETWNTVDVDGVVTPERAAELAERAVAVAARIDGVELDYSPRSLMAVDEIVESLRSADRTAVAGALLCLGCYAGEVFARRLGGAWAPVQGGIFDAPLFLSMAGGGALNPIGKVHKCFEYGDGDSVFALYHAVAFMPPFGG